MSKKAIAEAIGVDKSTVYREIKRNCDAHVVFNELVEVILSGNFCTTGFNDSPT